jgi:putative methyltransferase (TIGR04325 family)
VKSRGTPQIDRLMKPSEPMRWFLTGSRLRRGFATLERLLPPIVTDRTKRLLSEWEYVPGGWPTARGPAANGWDIQSVAAAQVEHWPVLARNLDGSGPLGVSHLPSQRTREDRADHNAMMSYAYVLARAARHKQAVSILDWGGGVGHYYLYSKALLPELAIHYHCYDVPTLCGVGKKLVPDAEFHAGADNLAGKRFDLVISSSSLHYFQDWQNTARWLVDRTGSFLYVARLPVVTHTPSFVVRQRPYGQGYETEFFSWFINRTELNACIRAAGLELIREFVFAEDWIVRGAPEQGESRGFLYQRPD